MPKIQSNSIEEDIKGKFKELTLIYQDNSANINSIDFSNLAELNWSTNPNQQHYLMLKPEQYQIRLQLIKLILSKYRLSTMQLTNQIIDKFSYQALADMNNTEDVSIKMLTRLRTIESQEFTLIKPAIIHLATTKPLLKVIGLTLIPNPIPYLQNKYKDTQNILDAVEHYKTMFTNKDIYCTHMPDIAAVAEIVAVDEVSAEDTFIKYSHQSAGFLKLFQPGYDVYFGCLKPYGIEKSLVIKENNTGIRNGYIKQSKFNRVLIDDVTYEQYLNNGLTWLNEDANSDKAKKMRDALYWFSYAIDEINLTNKFIYLITVLECILKNKGDKFEIMTTIAERTAFVLGNSVTNKINIFKEIKNIYNKRSDIIHNGITLVANDELMVLETCEMIRNLIITLLKTLSAPEITFENFINAFLDKKFTS